MNRRFVATLVIAAAGLLALPGCDQLDGLGSTNPGTGTGSPSADAPNAAGKPAPLPTSTPKSGTGDLPDVCALFTEAEVTAMTSRRIVQIDRDSAKPGDTSRYCQWQQFGGRLGISLTKMTRAQWDTKHPDAVAVAGLGDDAFALSGHLFVLKGGLQIDVYVSGGTAAEDLKLEKTVAQAVLPRV